MKIETNTIYHLPTQAHERNFLKQADKQGLRWRGTNTRADTESHWDVYNERYSIKVNDDSRLTYGTKGCYTANDNSPIIEWKIGFSKADMQIGQAYKVRCGIRFAWEKSDFSYYLDDLTTQDREKSNNNIVEVYPFPVEPIWKRSEPKYRVKTELTKEQAEKLGLEFCEEVKE